MFSPICDCGLWVQMQCHLPSAASGSQWTGASSGGRGIYRVSVASGGEAESLLDRVIYDKLDPDDADNVHEPRLIDR